MNFVLDHLWQSSIVLAAIGLLTFIFRNNGAEIRHRLWMAASLKFLVPFALLNGLGLYLARLARLDLPSFASLETVYAVEQPFSVGAATGTLPAPEAPVWQAALAIWLTGIFVLLAFWFSRWLTLRTALREARDAGIVAPMPVKLSPAELEPGLVGIFRPVLLLPDGITGRLDEAELRAVIAHEACHLRRRDNFWAALHMLVEAVLWFWPPVWWLGARLVAERERACDEAVLASGHAPQAYAESILKVCKFYVSSPLACAAGVSGSDLRQRMEEIMRNTVIARLTVSKKLLLSAAAGALVLTPLAAGLLWPPAAQAASCEPVAVQASHTLIPYPSASQKAGEAGTVQLRVAVARNGHVANVRVAGSSGHRRLDEAASNYVRQHYLWRPLACGSAQTDLKVVFSLADPREPFDQAKWVQHLQDEGARVERLGGNKFQVTLPPPPSRR